MGDDRQQATVRVQLVEPVGISWQDAKDQLYGAARFLSRAMNGAITDLVLEHRCGSLRSKRNRSGSVAQTRAYQLVVAHLDELGSCVGSHVALGSAGIVYARFQRFLKAAGDESLPSFKRTQPILVASGNARWTMKRVEHDVHLAAQLYKRGSPRLVFRIAGCGRGAWEHLRRMLDGGGVKLGELRFQYDRDRRLWFALLGYSWPATPQSSSKHTMVVHRGVSRFAVAVCSSGEATVIDDGVAMRRTKLAFSKRIAAIRGHLARHPGSGARGHGRGRRFKALERYRTAESAWADTCCKQLAARAVKQARQWGASQIVVEADTPTANDEASVATLGERVAWFVKRFPFYKLNIAIETACRRTGIAVKKVSLAYLSQRCPACGNVDPTQADHKRRNRHGEATPRFECLACPYQDDLDIVAGFNMLSKAGHDRAVQDTLSLRAKRVAQAKKAKRTRLQNAKQRRR